MSDSFATPRFRVLRECGDQWSAVAIQTLLLGNEIESHLIGTDAATALSMGGAPTDVLVRVQVKEEDFEAASEMLELHDQQLSALDAWDCPRCDEPNEPTFEFCWNCQAQRPSSPTLPLPSHVAVSSDPITVDVSELGPRQFSSNPYQPTGVQAQETKAKMRQVSLIDDTEENAVAYETSVRQALLLSIVAVLILPPFLCVLALIMLVRLPPRPASVAHPKVRLRMAWLFVLLGVLFGTLRLGFFTAFPL